jgi:hypothetical protein
MGTPEQWLEVLAMVKGLFKAITAGADLVTTIEKYRHDSETVEESRRVSASYSTYTEAEVDAIVARLNGCVQRFIKQGGGADGPDAFAACCEKQKWGTAARSPELMIGKTFIATCAVFVTSWQRRSSI